MEALITGANGFLGHHLVMALQERGDTLRTLVLPGEETSWLQERGVAIYRGDIRQPETLESPLRGVDTVFHLAAMIGVWAPMQDYYDVNVTGTKHICQAALKAGVRRMVHVSSTMVYGLGIRRLVTEDFPLAPFPEPYAMTKAAGERVVWRMIGEDHLPAVITRLGTVFGPGDRLHFGRMAERLRLGKGLVIGNGRNALSFCYMTDVVQGLLLAADHEHAAGQAYNVTNDQLMTQEELLRAIAEEIGAKGPLIHVPYYPLYAAAWAAEQVSAALRSHKQPIVTRLGVKLFGTENRHSIAKARKELGFAPQISLREGVRLAAAWYQHQIASAPVDTPMAAA